MRPGGVIANLKHGMSLVEVILGVSIVTVVAWFIVSTINQFVLTRNTIMSDTRQVYLAEEGYEMVRLLRDESWSNLSSLTVNNNNYLAVSSTTITATTTPEVIDGELLRKFVLRSVYRLSGNIVASTTGGATVDSNAREVEVSVGDKNGTTTMRAILMDFSSL